MEKTSDARSFDNETKVEERDGASSSPASVKMEGEKEVSVETTAEPAPPVEEKKPEPEYATGFKLLTIVTGVTLVALLMLLDVSIIVTAIPRITNEFHSLLDVGWYGSAYQLAAAALQPLTGRVYANLNSKWSYLGFFFVFEIGSLICALANSSKMLIVGRAIAGIGTSGILNGAFTIIAGCVHMSKRPTVIGIVLGISQLGLAIGPLIGGAITQYTTWRWCFWINLPAGGLVAALLFFVHIPDPIPKEPFRKAIKALPGKLDLVGFALLAGFSIMFLLALQYGGNEYAWNSSVIIGLFVGSGVTLIAFSFWNRHMQDKAMIPLSILGQRKVWSSALTYGLLMAQINLASYYLPIYFQGVRDADPLHSGVYVLPSVLSHLIVAFLAGKLVERVGYYLPVIAVSAVGLSVANGLLTTLSVDTSTGKWIGYQIILGAFRGLGLSVPILAVQHALPPKQIPIGTAIVMFSQSFGGALFLSIGSTIFNNSLRTLVHQDAPAVDPEALITAGATGFRTFVSGSDLAGVLTAYALSVDNVFYLATAMGICCFLFCWGMGWVDIRPKPQKKDSPA